MCSASVLAFQAHSHVTVVSAPYIANTTNIIELNIPHGCSDELSGSEDTVRIEVKVPSTITNIRAMDAVFGQANTQVIDETSDYTLISWDKVPGTERESDTQFYRVGFRGKLPDSPFSTIYLPTTQYCINDAQEQISVSWDAHTSGHHYAAAQSSGNPAPSLMVMPSRYPGWNQYTTVADQHLHDMSIFNDAEIVWWNDAAYSVNPVTKTMIENNGTAVLSEIHDNATFWVKY